MKRQRIFDRFFEKREFVHESEETFFSDDGGLKFFTIAIVKEWIGDDTFDDYVR